MSKIEIFEIETEQLKKKVAFDENSVLTNIGNSVFENCTSLGVIDIPEGVSSIYAEAFLNCLALTEVKIPKSTTTVDNFAFEGCDKLHTVYYGGESANDWMDISIGTNRGVLMGCFFKTY